MRYLQDKTDTKSVKLDLKDRKILAELCNNCRIPMTRLSKKVSLSKDAVKYRVNNYEKKGLIHGYRTMINISKFGYQNYHLFIKLNNPNEKMQKELIKKLIKNPNIRAVIRFCGSFDFEIALIAKDLSDLDRVISGIINDFSKFIQDKDLLIFRKLYVTRGLPKSFSESIANVKQKDKKYRLDKKDIEILKLISENAKLPLYEIGDKIGLSADAVAYRMKKMKESKIINKFVPIINFSSLNYNVYTVLFHITSLDSEKEKILEEFLINDKNILWAVKTIGKYNLLAYFLVEKIDDLQNSLFKLRQLFPGKINQHQILIAYEEYKYTYFPKELF